MSKSLKNFITIDVSFVVSVCVPAWIDDQSLSKLYGIILLDSFALLSYRRPGTRGWISEGT